MEFSFKINLSFGAKKKAEEKREKVYVEDVVRLFSDNIAQLSVIHSYATVRNYKTALRSLAAFSRKEGNSMPITNAYIIRYRGWLLDNGISQNTASCYLRSLRSLLNQLTNADKNLFCDLRMDNSTTRKRAITTGEVVRIANLNLEHAPHLAFYRDVFLFCIYTFGIPFVDIVQLKPENISDGRLSYTRQKTGQQITVSLLPEAESIIKRYVVADGASLFPFTGKYGDYSRYQYELTKYNKALKEIAKLAKVQKELTSYVARHTWASIALQAGVNPSVISQALGHTSLHTTEIYLKQLDITQIAEAGTSVVNYIFH